MLTLIIRTRTGLSGLCCRAVCASQSSKQLAGRTYTRLQWRCCQGGVAKAIGGMSLIHSDISHGAKPLGSVRTRGASRYPWTQPWPKTLTSVFPRVGASRDGVISPSLARPSPQAVALPRGAPPASHVRVRAVSTISSILMLNYSNPYTSPLPSVLGKIAGIKIKGT